MANPFPGNPANQARAARLMGVLGLQLMWHAILTEGSWQGEVVNRCRNGETYPQRLTISVVRDESGELTSCRHLRRFVADEGAGQRPYPEIFYNLTV